jgi:flavin-binding protein dodecin
MAPKSVRREVSSGGLKEELIGVEMSKSAIDDWNEGWAAGYQDALDAAVQRVEALPWIFVAEDGHVSVNAFGCPDIVAAIKGDQL